MITFAREEVRREGFARLHPRLADSLQVLVFHQIQSSSCRRARNHGAVIHAVRRRGVDRKRRLRPARAPGRRDTELVDLPTVGSPPTSPMGHLVGRRRRVWVEDLSPLPSWPVQPRVHHGAGRRRRLARVRGVLIDGVALYANHALRTRRDVPIVPLRVVATAPERRAQGRRRAAPEAQHHRRRLRDEVLVHARRLLPNARQDEGGHRSAARGGRPARLRRAGRRRPGAAGRFVRALPRRQRRLPAARGARRAVGGGAQAQARHDAREALRVPGAGLHEGLRQCRLHVAAQAEQAPAAVGSRRIRRSARRGRSRRGCRRRRSRAAELLHGGGARSGGGGGAGSAGGGGGVVVGGGCGGVVVAGAGAAASTSRPVPPPNGAAAGAGPAAERRCSRPRRCRRRPARRSPRRPRSRTSRSCRGTSRRSATSARARSRSRRGQSRRRRCRRPRFRDGLGARRADDGDRGARRAAERDRSAGTPHRSRRSRWGGSSARRPAAARRTRRRRRCTPTSASTTRSSSGRAARARCARAATAARSTSAHRRARAVSVWTRLYVACALSNLAARPNTCRECGSSSSP